MLLITSGQPSQLWFLGLLKMYVKNLIILSSPKELLKDLKGNFLLLVLNNWFGLVTWTISCKIWLQRDYQMSCQTLKGNLQLSIASEFGRNDVPSALTGECLSLDVIKNLCQRFQQISLKRDLNTDLLVHTGQYIQMSSFYDPINNASVGNRCEISSVMTDVFNKRPIHLLWNKKRV